VNGIEEELLNIKINSLFNQTTSFSPRPQSISGHFPMTDKMQTCKIIFNDKMPLNII
jgi:hypothetical protein